MADKKEKQHEIEVELTEQEIEFLEKIAEEKGCSFNDAAVEILENFIKEQNLESEVEVKKIEEDNK